MSAAICSLLAFAALTLLLVMIVVSYRTSLVFTGKTPANSWTRQAEKWENPAWVTRMEHAHLNCLENLPLFGAIVLAAFMLDNLAVVDAWAYVYMAFRVTQVLIHLISTSAVAVFLRANMFVGQWACLIYWLLALAGII